MNRKFGLAKLLLKSLSLSFLGISIVLAAPQDLTGYWRPLITEDYNWRMLGTVKGEYGGIEMNDEARAIADQFSNDIGDDQLLYDKCGPHGAARIMRTNTRLYISQDDAQITMQLEAEGQTRHFYLDKREWSGGELQWQGHSVAYEDGKSLLTVITKHMRAASLRSNGIPYSEEATLTEHYTRHGDYFTVIQIVEDPKYLTAPLITSTSFHKIPIPRDWHMGSCQL